MDKPIISVLIPVYNCKQYINTALDSVLNQTFQEFEVVLFNDGSTDGSGSILEEYSKKDARIHVIHSQNKGLANARNCLVMHAKGEFVAFLDGDDYLDPEYLERLYRALIENDSDISVCSYYKYSDEDNMLHYPYLEEGYEVRNYTPDEIYQNYYSETNGFNISLTVAWCKLIRRELFEKMHFPEGKIHEDSYTIYKLYYKAKKITYVNRHLYMYRIRETSIMTTKWTRERINDFIGQHEERIALLTAMGKTISSSNISDYVQSLKNFRKIALDNGFVEEYLLLDEKLHILSLSDKSQN